MKDRNKRHLKEIARMWVGSMLISQDDGMDDCDLSEKERKYIVEQCNKMGERILGDLPFITTLNDSVDAVTKKYYEQN